MHTALSTRRPHEVATTLRQQAGLPARAARGNTSLSSEAQSESSPVADRPEAPVAPGYHAVIGAMDGDAHGPGALRVAQALVSRFRSEAVTLPSTAVPSAVGRQADSRGRAIVVLPGPNADSGERPTYADRACRVAPSTRHPVLLIPESRSGPHAQCLAAVDFGRSSIAAAVAAMELLEAPAELALAFVHLGHEEDCEAHSVPQHVHLLVEALTRTFAGSDWGDRNVSGLERRRAPPFCCPFLGVTGPTFYRSAAMDDPRLRGSPQCLSGPRCVDCSRERHVAP